MTSTALPDVPDEARVLVLLGDMPLIRTDTLSMLCDLASSDVAILSARIDNPPRQLRVYTPEITPGLFVQNACQVNDHVTSCDQPGEDPSLTNVGFDHFCVWQDNQFPLDAFTAPRRYTKVDAASAKHGGQMPANKPRSSNQTDCLHRLNSEIRFFTRPMTQSPWHLANKNNPSIRILVISYMIHDSPQNNIVHMDVDGKVHYCRRCCCYG